MLPSIIKTPWDDLELEKLVDQAIATGQTKIKRLHMKLGPYNGFTGDQRDLADWKIKIAKELKLIPPPEQCSICGTKEGEFHYHNEDYSRPLQTIAICKKCHMALHNRFRAPGYSLNWGKLVHDYGDGTKWFEQISRTRN